MYGSFHLFQKAYTLINLSKGQNCAAFKTNQALRIPLWWAVSQHSLSKALTSQSTGTELADTHTRRMHKAVILSQQDAGNKKNVHQTSNSR